MNQISLNKPCPQNDVTRIYEVIARQRYGVEYQPIVDVKTNDIIGYEALARFYDASGKSISPLIVFEHLHSNLPVLQQVELELKRLQLEYAPSDFKLFINLDPHAVDVTSLKTQNLFKQFAMRGNIIVELIENSDIHEARASAILHTILSENNIETALDDIGAPHSLLSLEILSMVKYLKFDRSWINNLENSTYASMFNYFINFARDTEKKVILEGIETESMLELARKFKLEVVQGFLYKPQFINIKA
jgi:EAL domain-containing protein (putative c-di-GMP-specific phosphodiesterase class I)